MTRRCLPGNSPGFTLVEMLVAILLLSLIVVALSGGLRFGARVWQTSDTVAAGEERAELGSALVRELLGDAVPVMRGEYAEFDGHRTALSFDTNAPAALDVPGLARVTLVLEADRTLAIRMTAARKPDVTKSATLSTGLAAPRFSYLDASEGKAVWLALWRDRDRLPDAVRIDGESAGASGAWPMLIVRLPIAQRPDCIFDPVSLACRPG